MGPEQKANKHRSDENVEALWSPEKSTSVWEVRASRAGGREKARRGRCRIAASGLGPALEGAPDEQVPAFLGGLAPVLCVLGGLGEPLPYGLCSLGVAREKTPGSVSLRLGGGWLEGSALTGGSWGAGFASGSA